MQRLMQRHKKVMEKLPHSVSLTVTEGCNLSCTYCYEHSKSPRMMDIKTAKAIIDRELKETPPDIELDFDFFGGEPFLAFPLIRGLTEYICEKAGDRPYVLFASTNGTLIHGEIQDWLRDHPCFYCGLSLDGTREAHNLNRCNSYDDIDLDFFLEQYPEQDVKMTIARNTLPMFADGVIELHEKGFQVSCNLAYGIDWSDKSNAEILESQLMKLIDYYLSHPDIEPCSMLNMSIETVGIDADKQEHTRWCGAGKYMTTYDVEGNPYPCQFFMPLSIGKEKAEQAKSLVFPDDIVPEELLEHKCRDCVIAPVCPNCFGSNYASTGNIYKRDSNLCTLTKITMKARSYFRAEQWKRGQLKGSEDDIQLILRAILKIQNELNIED